jgi:hypothetical protein
MIFVGSVNMVAPQWFKSSGKERRDQECKAQEMLVPSALSRPRDNLSTYRTSQPKPRQILQLWHHRLHPQQDTLRPATMVLLSSPLLLRTYSLTILVCAYYLLTSPQQLFSATPVWLLGESMSIRPASYALENPVDPSNPKLQLKGLLSGHGSGKLVAERELFALLAVVAVVYASVLGLFAGDLNLPTPSAGGEGGGDGSAATTRSSSRLAEEIHTLLTAQSRWLTLAGLHVLGSSVFVGWIYLLHSHSDVSSGQSVPSSSLSGLDLLANRVTFTIALTDMLFWGYLWTVLKEEGREVAKLLARRKAIEDEDQ